MTAKDVSILRELARKVREIAESPRMQELRKKWFAHNERRTTEPLVFVELFEIKDPLFPALLQCETEEARAIEKKLRTRIFQAENVQDDTVVDANWPVNWKVKIRGWKEKLQEKRSLDMEGRNLGHVAVPILEDPWDVEELEKSTFEVDRKGTMEELWRMQCLFGDILNVQIEGVYWWTMGTTATFLRITGMEDFLIMPYDDPEAFHRIMQFMEDDQLAFLDFLQKEDLFTLNCANHYVGSGTHGFTTQLPAKDFTGTVRPKDLWVLMESQESVTMSPKMFGEFIFPYQKRMAERFGLCYYGCCEPLHDRFDYVKTIENLHSLSVSPWCDMASIAEQMEGKYIFCRKQNPAWISTERFEEDLLREDTRAALAVTKDLPSEFVMKDLHTVNGDFDRCRRWTELVREEILRARG